MKKNDALRTAVFFDSLALTAADKELPVELFLPFGEYDATKGRTRIKFSLTAKDGERQVQEFSTRGKDLVVDYEHQTLTGKEAPASGWVDGVENDVERELDGSPVHGIAYKIKEWTQKAKDYLSSGEYRYWSPVFAMSRRHPIVAQSFALTNDPAIHDLPALVAKGIMTEENSQSEQLEEMMKTILDTLSLKALADEDENEAQVVTALKAVIAERDAALAATVELGECLTLHEVDSLDALTAKIQTLVPADELIALKAKQIEAEADAAVAELMKPAVGKCLEAFSGWAKKFYIRDKEGFIAHYENAPRVLPLNATEDLKTGKEEEGTLGMSGVEGVDDESYKAFEAEFGKEAVEAHFAALKANA